MNSKPPMHLGEGKYGDHTLLLKAFEAGFNAGVYFESEQEAFAKTTREPYKTPKEHVRSLFEKFLKKMEGG